MTDIFKAIKQSLDIVTVATDFGIILNRSNKALSPFSSEKTPSFQIYQDTQSFYCYSTNQGGTVIDLVMKLTGLSAIETAKLLNEKYNLKIALSKPLDTKDIQYINNKQIEREAINLYRKSAHIVLSKYYRLLNEYKRVYAPLNSVEEPNLLFIEALNNLDNTEYLCNLINICSDEEVKEFYKKYNEEVIRIAKRIGLEIKSFNGFRKRA